MNSHRYLWMAPNAGLWDSFKIEHRLAEAIAVSGRSVTMLHCDGILDTYCPVMASRRLTVESPRSDKSQVCKDCLHNSNFTAKASTYDVDSLDRFVTSEVIHRAEMIISSINHENYLDLEIDGVPVGRYATYLVLLQHKASSITDSAESWEEYLTDLRNALIMHFTAPTIFEEYKPTHLVVYNPLYPVNRMMVEFAAAHTVQLVSVTAGSYVPARFDTVGIYPHLLSAQTFIDSESIKDSFAIPLSGVEVRAVGRHLEALMSGSDLWVYSVSPRRLEGAEIRRQLGLREHAPVATVLISSPDETRASRMVDAEIVRDSIRGFSDIAEFLRAAVGAAERMPDVDFVFRLHPRLFPNKRESVLSPDVKELMRVLDDLPENAHINAPSDELSLYDVLKISSCGINQSSSTGLEFMVFGIPVVQFDPIRMALYPPEFGLCVERDAPEQLIEAIRQSLASNESLETSRKAFRWLGVILLRTLLHFRSVDSYAAPTVIPSRDGVAGAQSSRALNERVMMLKKVIPERLRERGARYLDRKSRADTLSNPSADQPWHAEFLQRLDATVGGPIWNPPVIPRGYGDILEETAAIEEVLGQLRSHLGLSIN
jgi:hypothetical protein